MPDGESDIQKERSMKIESSLFGVTRNGEGEKVTAYTITNSKGSRITVIDYGAILTEVVVPDRDGKLTDVALGYDNIGSYEVNPPYLGATIGRNGNRIEGGSFNLGGVDYQLALNENERNNLHSGPDGYNFRMWSAAPDEESGSVTFSLVSPDGDQGFPGELKISVTYSFSEDNTVGIRYEGVSSADTIVNMTNHSYFNLSGAGSGSIMEHELMIDADGYTPVDEYSIPYGTVESVEDTPFDFREMKRIGRDAYAENDQLEHTGGYDHNFALNGTGMRKAAEACSEVTGITMTVTTDQPGIQFYAGNFISGPCGKGGCEYRPHDGFALETQHFPNSMNVLAFESPKLSEGEIYSTTTCYSFGIRE